jgi:hypothetical protein
MRRPAGVILAAIVLGFMALMGIFGSLISVAATIFMHNPAIPPIPGVRAIMVVMTGGMLCFFLFCAWTVVGLFWMRPWARYSILVIGGLEFCFSLLMCGVMVLLRASPPPMPVAATSSPVSFQAVFLGMAASYGFLSLIGAWWLVYFNLKPVRAAFAGTSPAVIEPGLGESQVLVAQPQAGMPGWRIVIVVWASLMLMSALYVPLVFLMHIPLFVFGFVLRGSAATATLLAMLAVQVWLGFGLLKKWTAAWYLAMAWQALYGISAGVVGELGSDRDWPQQHPHGGHELPSVSVAEFGSVGGDRGRPHLCAVPKARRLSARLIPRS